MRSTHMPFAIVVDDQGGMSGIVTLEDLVEELVGEIVTEHSHRAAPAIQKEPNGTAIVAGGTSLHGVNRELGLDLPEGADYSTVAGLCLAIAGRIPAIGDQIPVPGRAILEIIDASRQRVRTVRIWPASTQVKIALCISRGALACGPRLRSLPGRRVTGRKRLFGRLLHRVKESAPRSSGIVLGEPCPLARAALPHCGPLLLLVRPHTRQGQPAP